MLRDEIIPNDACVTGYPLFVTDLSNLLYLSRFLSQTVHVALLRKLQETRQQVLPAMLDKALMLHFKMADLRELKKNLRREEPAYDLKSTTKWIMKQRKEHQMRFSWLKTATLT